MTPRSAARVGALWALALVCCVACDSARTEKTAQQPSTPLASTAPLATPQIVTRYPAAKRLLAIGDLHGDMVATHAALRLAGLVDEADRWTGGDSVLVQTGDILDRGNDEQAIVDLFERLKKQARAAGGAVHVLNGNHELMNAAGDFRYVTPGGFADFADAPGLRLDDPLLRRAPVAHRARYAALLPGRPYAIKLARHPVVLIVGDTVFAHGGVLPAHVTYGLERINREVSAWLLGGSTTGRSVISVRDSPVWTRRFSQNEDAATCELLSKTLKQIGVKRLVVGHTVQRTITSACADSVWRIDVGMAAHYGGKPEVLQVRGAEVRSLR